jgi:hypothetical protein
MEFFLIFLVYYDEVVVSFDFQAQSGEGMEAFVVATGDINDGSYPAQNSIFGGCDGGFNGCKSRLSDDSDAVYGTQPTLVINQAYKFNLKIVPGDTTEYFLTITDGGNIIDTLNFNSTQYWNRFGFLVGRNQNGRVSCIDNIQVAQESNINFFYAILTNQSPSWSSGDYLAGRL